jgi:hypothetical protein
MTFNFQPKHPITMTMFISLNRRNTTQNQDQITCSNIGTDTVEIDLRWACDTNGLIQWCQPLFISIEAGTHDGTNMRCTDRECRFPDNSRFQIHGDNLGCWNGVGSVVASIALIALSIIMTTLRM